MKKVLGIVLSLALIVSTGTMLCTSAAGSADVVKQCFEVDFDKMTYILTNKGNDVGTTPFAMVAVSPDGTESPFSLVADANNGKKLLYNVTTGDLNKAHYLDFYVAAAPYARIVMKANIKESGNPRPYFRLYDAGLTTVQNDLWADQESADGKIYTFTFVLDATGTGVVRLNLGAYFLPGTRKTMDGSEAGIVELDDVTFDIEEYNELYTIGATEQLPTCLGYSNPVGLCIGSSFNGKYFSISEEYGSRIVHYKNNESNVGHAFIAIFDAGAALTQDTEYTLNLDARILETVEVKDIDLWIKMFACDAAGSMKYALCPLGSASDQAKAQASENMSYDELGVMEGGKFSIAASNAWKCGLMENVAAPGNGGTFFSQSKYTNEYASLGIKFIVPAGIRYVRIDMRLASSINNQFQKNEMFLKNILLEKNTVAEIIGADGWQEDLTSTVYNLVDVNDAAATFANELTFNSMNNPVVGVALNGNALMPGVDYTIANNKVKLAAAVQAEAAQENTVLAIRAANGNDYTFTVADLADLGIYITKSGENFIVGINGWNANHQYQIWTYQRTGSEIFGGEGLTNQWVLSHPYTLGSDRTADGFTVDGDAITRNIGSFESVDSNYTVAVKVIDGEGNFVGQYKDTFTQAQAGVVVINKVTVDGQFADDKPFIKDIAGGTPVQIVVTGNGVAGTEYTAKIDQGGAPLAASGAGNEFGWDISVMQPGNYSVTLTASTATSSDSRTVNFRLYNSTFTAASYGEIGGATSATEGAATPTHFAIDINAAGITGDWFRYRISEPWAGTIRLSDPIDASVGAIDVTDNNSIPLGKYGVYQVTGYTYRNGVASADDGFAKTVNYARGGVELDVTVDGASPGAGVTEKNKGDNIIISGVTNDTIPDPVVYSFWRRDANGWVLIRDYGEINSITWTPHRVGLYTIQVRAKAAEGLTYEVLKNIEFDITDATDQKAVVTNITINQAALDSGATARTPILIRANAASASQDLLYKFIIGNGYIHYVETAYSADSTYMWVPGKAGDYTINVLVKNQASFGKYDAVKTFTVTVN